MKAPFWWHRSGPIPLLLLPLSAVYAASTAWRLRLGKPIDPGVPVLCVGGAAAGGAGKTPVALDLLQRLHGAHGLSRGYGGNERGPLHVDPALHDHLRVGDEALLLSPVAPTWVARNRAAGARAAVTSGARAIIMDDGLQNPSLRKTVSLLVIDGGFGFGNRRVIPAGPLREPVDRTLARADAVVLIGEDTTEVCDLIQPRLPLLKARLAPDPSALSLRGQQVAAFAGIGRPEKFFTMLRRLGAVVVITRSFADHRRYTCADIAPIADAAARTGAVLVTTAKDAVRLPSAYKEQTVVASAHVTWNDESALEALLAPLRKPL